MGSWLCFSNAERITEGVLSLLVTRMLRYKFPSCRSMRIRMIRMSGPDPWLLLVGLLPQDTDRRCDLTGVVGVSAMGVWSAGTGGEESTSRQETEGDFMCLASLDRSWLTGDGKSNNPSASSEGLHTAEFMLEHWVMITVGFTLRAGLGSHGASI